jgi:hypothetical protein
MTIPQHKLKRKRVEDNRPIDPDRFYRKSEIIRRRFFGVGASGFDDFHFPLIKLHPPNGKASGMFGRTIIKLQQEIEARAAAKA